MFKVEASKREQEAADLEQQLRDAPADKKEELEAKHSKAMQAASVGLQKAEAVAAETIRCSLIVILHCFTTLVDCLTALFHCCTALFHCFTV